MRQFDRLAFIEYLCSSKDEGGKEQERGTAIDVASMVGTFTRSGKTPEDFIKSYSKPNSYNNALNALKHYCDFLQMPRPALKQKRRTPDSLITAPRVDEVQRVIREIDDFGVKCYVGLCSSVGLRPERLLKMVWSEVDFADSWIRIDERHGKKVYRPNPLHHDVRALLLQLKEESTSDRVFGFAYKRIGNALRDVGTDVRPNRLRDHYFNFARKSGMNPDLVEWTMGHSIGIKAHYMSGDELKSEYAKFESAYRILL